MPGKQKLVSGPVRCPARRRPADAGGTAAQCERKASEPLALGRERRSAAAAASCADRPHCIRAAARAARAASSWPPPSSALTSGRRAKRAAAAADPNAGQSGLRVHETATRNPAAIRLPRRQTEEFVAEAHAAAQIERYGPRIRLDEKRHRVHRVLSFTVGLAVDHLVRTVRACKRPSVLYRCVLWRGAVVDKLHSRLLQLERTRVQVHAAKRADHARVTHPISDRPGAPLRVVLVPSLLASRVEAPCEDDHAAFAILLARGQPHDARIEKGNLRGKLKGRAVWRSNGLLAARGALPRHDLARRRRRMCGRRESAVPRRLARRRESGSRSVVCHDQ
eukprot:7386461-Prymnesium_polylepis.2